MLYIINKITHLTSFGSPRSSMFPEAKPRGRLMVEGKNGNYLLHTDWHNNLARLQGARPDHVRVESLSCCFPWE